MNIANEKSFLLFCAFALTLGSANAGIVRWNFPREGCCHEGLPFSDGETGVLVWGGGDTVNMTIGRGDLWDHRGGYPWTDEQNYTNIVRAVAARDRKRLGELFRNDVPANWGGRYNPYMLPLGRLVLRLAGPTLSRGELDTATGLGRLVLSDGRAIELAMSKARRTFAVKISEGISFEVTPVPAMTQPHVREALLPRGFEDAKVSDNGFIWKLPADKPVALRFARKGGEVCVWTERGERESSTTSATFESVREDSLVYWTRFWKEGARVSVPDPVLQQIFDFGMYKFGAMTDPDGVPAGLQGQWLEDDKLVPWNGDYHFNINVQECYSPAYRGGHFRNLMPLFRMVLSWRPLLKDNARKFVGVDGYVLPHSVDDRGICIGGFWAGTIDHASTAWMASLMMRYVRYAGDVEFLRSDALDFMKGAMRVYRAMMEEKDGRLSIPVCPSPEWGDSDVERCVGRDPSFQLAAAHRLARDLIEAAKLAGEPVDPMWVDVERRLPAYTAGGPQGGILLFEGQGLEESHRHHSHMAGLYPFDTIDLMDAKTREVVHATYWVWTRMGTGLWSGWCVPWASILNVHFGRAEAAVSLLRAWKTFYTNPGHGSLHDAFVPGFSVMTGRPTVMQMDGQCAAVTAVMELLAHETNGKVEFFKGCPANWENVSFENLALSDGRRVSGSRVNGIVTVTFSK